MARSREMEGPTISSPLEPRGASSVGLLDREAWDCAVRQHNHRVVVSLLAAGVPADRAVDLAQATWTRLIEQDRAGKLDDVRLPGIALAQARLLVLEARRHDSIDARRHRPLLLVSDEPAADDASVVIDFEADDADPEQQTLDREQLERALAVIASASPSAQRVFRLVYADPKISHADAAAAVGISTQRVRQILCDLRKKIRASLEGDDA